MKMYILLHMCIIFQIFNKLSYFRIQQIKLSFLHIRLILQNFSLFSICEIFNIIDHTYIEFHNFDTHKTQYTFIFISTHFFFTVHSMELIAIVSQSHIPTRIVIT